MQTETLSFEQAVLGSILLDNECIHDVIPKLKPVDFSTPTYQDIYSKMCQMADDRQPIDTVTLTGKFPTGVLIELMDSVATADNASYYADKVHTSSLRRRLKEAGRTIYNIADQDDFEGARRQAESMILDVAQSGEQQDLEPVSGLVNDVYKMLEERQESKGASFGKKTGFKELDDLITGVGPTEVVVLAARPAMGKSSVMAQWALNVMKNDKTPVAIFSLEMSKTEVTVKLLSQLSGVDSKRMNEGRMNSDEWGRTARACAELSEMPLHINDNPFMTMTTAHSQCRRIKAKHGLGMAMFDYLQLMTDGVDDNRNEDVSRISRKGKLLAKDLEVTTVLLSQLNRGVENRTNKRPMLSDLRDSGSIEQDADKVIFLYRPHYYDESEDPRELELILRKNRQGATGTCVSKWQRECTRIY